MPTDPLTPRRPAGHTAAAHEAQRRYDELSLYVLLVAEVRGTRLHLARVLDADPTYRDAMTQVVAA